MREIKRTGPSTNQRFPNQNMPPTYERPLGRRLLHSPYFYPALAIPIALLVFAAAKAGDAYLAGRLTRELGFSVANVRTVFGAVSGAVVTATAVVFWVRSALVQLDASRLSPRLLSLYMHDRFQQITIGALLAVFTYLVATLLTLPRSAEASAPLVSTWLGILLAVSALLVIIVAIIQSVLTTRLSEVLAAIAEDTLTRITQSFPPHDPSRTLETPADLPEPPLESARHVTSPAHGWIQRLDSEEILGVLPPGSRFWLDVRVGMYLTEDAHIGYLLLPSAGDDSFAGCSEDEARAVIEQVRAAVHIRTTRSLERDIGYGIRELVDVGLSALSPGTTDTTAAFEVILQLGVVLRQILLSDFPAAHICDSEGRELYRTAELTHSDYVDLCFQQLRLYGSKYPSVAIGLLSTLGMLKGQLLRAGLIDRVPAIQRQGELVVKETGRSGLLEADQERVHRAAVWYGFAPPPAGQEEDLPTPPAGEQMIPSPTPDERETAFPDAS
ncbi:MAG: hypothetical protein Kow00129_00100 [Thermoleophilia bacterium]